MHLDSNNRINVVAGLSVFLSVAGETNLKFGTTENIYLAYLLGDTALLFQVRRTALKTKITKNRALTLFSCSVCFVDTYLFIVPIRIKSHSFSALAIYSYFKAGWRTQIQNFDYFSIMAVYKMNSAWSNISDRL